ncbi:Pkinase-domain-containing protein [Fomitiporia mediterranea MF3/22]|uniref:Pkinase-domain-containing protein n=1 Tax=Fomitiporia mediterranea (strain MF3/22) TaxID=694068 RepID=UPI000440910A|nr:Pkinase-domain-containing protein [Fomitiporia mediterranea MF3/22]EJD08478.1 Pkinase-domain-containing protein [Fomitiporia mediterranea MF3/22]
MSIQGHKHSASSSQNLKAQLANAYNELGKELSSTKVKVVGNYTLGRVIGEGTYGKVRLGTHRLTSTRVAIKQIPKAMSAALTREIHHHRRLHHPHVCKLYEVIATESTIWLVTELCSGGELFDYLAEKGRLSEEESRAIFGQLCLAVGYIHEKGVVHRDLKLENVLLDERCRIKLGDFGFTREFERGSLLDTYCGTTGYAAPEMLMAKKYLGPEVDIWSLGVILYCLLTGTLPFDDDDEAVMREKIIVGEFENPDWLSADARDLLRNILQYDPAKRLSITQILAHPWFSRPSDAAPQLNIATNVPSTSSVPAIPLDNSSSSAQHLPSPSTSEASFHSAPSEPPLSASPVADESFAMIDNISFDSNASERTVKQREKKMDMADPGSRRKKSAKGRTLAKSSKQEDDIFLSRRLSTDSRDASRSRDPSPAQSPTNFPGASPGPSLAPTAYPTRTPARTKRRSVSSILSQPSSPVSDSHPVGVPPQDFASLLRTPAPLLFSTPLERQLLNNLSILGFDIGQMVHSVLSDACDATGAMWWMLKRKAEKKALESAFKKEKESAAHGDVETELETELEIGLTPSLGVPESPAVEKALGKLEQSRSAPELAFVPATPTVAEARQKKNASPPVTPPRSKSPRSFLSPTPTSMESTKSAPSTPGKEKDGKDGSKGRSSGKARSGSVSIVQRATMTALEAAGLVRKKSTEAVKEDKDKDKERTSSSSDSRNGHANATARLTKSPPIRPVKDVPTQPSTPEHEKTVPTSLPSASPWVPVARSSTFTVAPTPANSPGNTNDFGADGSHKLFGPVRNRNNLLTTFRMWFNEDRKGKRKAAVPPPVNINASSSGPVPVPPSPRPPRNTFKRRGGWSGQKPRAKRASISSRRSSSINSRRSSVASMQMVLMETPQHGMDNISRQRSDPSRRSFTPNSEVEREVHSSRPSSIRSYSMQGRHRKSPSAGSSGSTARYGRASPLKKYHQRAGSSSSTRVVRQARPSSSQNLSNRPAHVRSNSTTSSIHSLPSSRPGSFYDASEGESQRAGYSPLRSADDPPRRSCYSTVLLAQKKQSTFGPPSAASFITSVRSSSWKKAWGTEPPGWRSRQPQFPVEVLAVSPAPDQPMTIRDVFSGRQSINLGDDSDWVDEDDDFPAFAGGLGQIPTNASMASKLNQKNMELPMQLSPVPRPNNRGARKAGRGRGGARTRAGHSPITGTMPLPGSDGVFDVPPESIVNETRMSRRQLPNGRSAPAFKSAIVEEEEEEEEE